MFDFIEKHILTDFAPSLWDGDLYWALTQDCAALILHPNTQRPRVGDPGSWAIIASPSGRKNVRRCFISRGSASPVDD